MHEHESEFRARMNEVCAYLLKSPICKEKRYHIIRDKTGEIKNERVLHVIEAVSAAVFMLFPARGNCEFGCVARSNRRVGDIRHLLTPR